MANFNFEQLPYMMFRYNKQVFLKIESNDILPDAELK